MCVVFHSIGPLGTTRESGDVVDCNSQRDAVVISDGVDVQDFRIGRLGHHGHELLVDGIVGRGSQVWDARELGHV